MVRLDSGFSLVLDIMRLFQRSIGTRDEWTAEEVWAHIKDHPHWYWDHELRFMFSRLSRNIQGQIELVEAALRSLAELGVVSSEGDRETSSGFGRWRIASSWQPPGLPPGRDGGGNGDAPVERSAGEDGEGEGGGIREVLSHPVLFALDQDDFDGFPRADSAVIRKWRQQLGQRGSADAAAD